jgi:transcriptional regulator of acetoin/glycerol metabolism
VSDLVHVREIERVLRGDMQGSARDVVVQESWRRCINTYGLDPTRPDPAHVVTDSELRMHREQSEELIATARSGLQSLFRLVANDKYILILADAKGVSVDFFGDRAFEAELKQAGLYLGSNWSESLAGTSGVGSCLYTGEAVTIHQDDHFGMAHTPLSCTAAPIYDTLGRLCAVLDVSLLRSPSPKSSQNLAMNLVLDSVRRIEMANLMTLTRRDWVLRFSTSPKFLEVDPEAAVALDGSGRIIGMTHGARKVLAQGGDTELIGKDIGTVLDMSADDLPDLMRGRPIEERVLRLKDGRGVFGHAIAPQSARITRRATPADLPDHLSNFAGPDPALDALLKRAVRLTQARVSIVLAGETGTGKEHLARALHVIGNPGKAFHKLRCSGATPEQIARLTDAPTGTLFLKGADDLSDPAQQAILALLDAHENLRTITSTRTDLNVAVQEGRFRPDLFFRLVKDTLTLPPLRQRHDIGWLINRLLRRRNSDNLRLSAGAHDALCSRQWPGNIRELEGLLDVVTALAQSDVIDVHDLPDEDRSVHVCEISSAALESLLEACGWNMSRVARRLDLNRSTVLRRVRKSGLIRPD